MRKQHTLSVVALVAAAGLAPAAVVTDLENEFLSAPGPGMEIDATGLDLIALDVSGISIDESQGFGSVVFEFTLEPLTRVVGLGWELDVTTTEAGTLSDLQLAFASLDEFGDPDDGVLVQPSELTFAATNGFSESSADDGYALLSGTPPVIDLASLGMSFDGNGRLVVELFTEFPGEAIELGAGSTLYIAVERIPAPAGVASLFVAGCLASRRRRMR